MSQRANKNPEIIYIFFKKLWRKATETEELSFPEEPATIETGAEYL